MLTLTILNQHIVAETQADRSNGLAYGPLTILNQHIVAETAQHVVAEIAGHDPHYTKPTHRR